MHKYITYKKKREKETTRQTTRRVVHEQSDLIMSD